MSLTAHASAANVWGYCTGSIPLNAEVKRPKTQDQREGDAMHYIGEQMLRACIPGSTTRAFEENDFVGGTDPAGTVLTPEMYASAAEYAFRVLEVANQTVGMDALRIEQSLPCDVILPGKVDVPDAWFFDAAGMTVYVFDAKFGHRYVPAEGNLQFVDYAAAIMTHLGINGHEDQRLRFVFEIIQPRCFYSVPGKPQLWAVVASDLRGAINSLATAANAGTSGKGQLKSGAHCLSCSAAHVCNASRLSAGSVMDYVVGYPTPSPLDDAGLAYEKKLLDHAADLIKSRATAVDAEMEARILAGKLIPGFSMQSGLGRRAWAVPVEQIAELGEAFNIEATESKPVTPAEFERRAKKAKVVIDEAVISAYTHRPSTGYKITPDDGSKAQKTFNT